MLTRVRGKVGADYSFNTKTHVLEACALKQEQSVWVMCCSQLCVVIRVFYQGGPLFLKGVDSTKNGAKLTGFQTGSGQMGFSQKGHISLHVAVCCFKCARVGKLLHMLPHVATCCHMLPYVAIDCLHLPVKVH